MIRNLKLRYELHYGHLFLLLFDLSRYGLLESSYVPGYPFSLPFKYELFYAQY